MEEYIKIRKRTLFCWIGAIAIAATALLVWHYLSINRETPPKDMEVRSYNILMADGKAVLYFRSIDSDSVFTDASLTDRTINTSWRAAVSGAGLHRVIAVNKRFIEKKIKYLESATHEMKYYLDVHGVQDEGYDMVVSHYSVIKKETTAAKHLLNSLESITDRSKLEIKQVVIRTDETNLKPSPIFVESNGGLWINGRWIKTKRQGQGLSADSTGRLICGVWNEDTLTVGKRTDSCGIYSGQFDRTMSASGHGAYTYTDGTFYEGRWKNDCRDGFGFYVKPTKLMVGEWKADRYKGERMKYTSERIYGIDISRYQHGRGRHYYPIHWNKLRITHLGSISRKTVSGVVDYPISFLYIKSTEGTSVYNRYYKADYVQARRYGIVCGAYHFFSTRSSATAQARYFLKHSYFRKGDLPPVLDVEPTHKQIAKMGGTKEMFNRIRIWLNIVKQRTGVRPILYISQMFVNRYLVNAPDIKRNYNIWIARYGEYKPDVKLVYWQLCPDGRVKGIHGEVDVNVFNGYREQFDEFLQTERIK